MQAAGWWVVYQPLLVGFGAVVLATIGNTALEWYRQNLHDRREAATLRRAFVEELRTQRRISANSMTDEQRGETEGSFMVPMDQFLPVYEHMIGRIGVLRPEEAAAILKAYSHILLSPKNLLLLGSVHRDPLACFVQVPATHADLLARLNGLLVGVIDDALQTLDPDRKSGDEIRLHSSA